MPFQIVKKMEWIGCLFVYSMLVGDEGVLVGREKNTRIYFFISLSKVIFCILQVWEFLVLQWGSEKYHFTATHLLLFFFTHFLLEY